MAFLGGAVPSVRHLFVPVPLALLVCRQGQGPSGRGQLLATQQGLPSLDFLLPSPTPSRGGPAVLPQQKNEK